MIWGTHFGVALKNIIAPGDLAARQKQPHVIALADTFRRYGGRPGNVMWVFKRAKGWELNAGRDRFAALMLIGAKRDIVREILEASREELADLEEIENLYRRPIPDRDRLVAAHVAKVAARIEVERSNTGQPSAIQESKPGPKQTAKGEAREKVAAGMGTSPEAVRKAEQRAAAKERDEAGAAPADAGRSGPGVPPPPPPVDCYGHDLPAHVRDDATPAVAAARKIDQLLRQAQALAADLLGVVADRIRAQLHDVAALVRAEALTHLCPYCKGKFVKGKPCRACNGVGAVARGVFESAPAELRVTAEEYAAGLDAPAATPGEAVRRARAIPPIKAGVTYTTDAAGDVVEQAADIDRHIARAAKAKAPAKPKRGLTVQINDGPVMSVAEAQRFVDEAEQDDDGGM